MKADVRPGGGDLNRIVTHHGQLDGLGERQTLTRNEVAKVESPLRVRRDPDWKTQPADDYCWQTTSDRLLGKRRKSHPPPCSSAPRMARSRPVALWSSMAARRAAVAAEPVIERRKTMARIFITGS